MNGYQTILENTIGTEATKDLMKWARKFTKLYYSPMGDMSKAAQKWISQESRYELSELQAIAIVAVKKGNKKQSTMNLNDICTATNGDIIYKSIFELQKSGLIDLYRVAQPYQIVFTY